MKVHNPKATGIPSIKPVPFEQHLVNLFFVELLLNVLGMIFDL
jgi:hypothetical protein